MMAGLGDGGGNVATGGTTDTGSGSAGSTSGGSTGVSNTGGTAGSTGAGSTGGTQGTTANLGSSGETKSWRDSLPDELKADPTLSKYSDITNLSKAHIELQKKFGQKGIFKPGKDASPEEIKSFREAMGIPTDPAKYELGEFEGIKVPPETIAWAQKMGSEHGIEPSALKAVMTEYMKLEASVGGAQAKQKLDADKAALEGLKAEWGDAYDRNISRANFAAEKLGGKGLIDSLVKAGVQNNPAILKAFADAAKLFGEDKLREAGAGDGRQTPEELDAEIAAVQGRLFSMKPTDGAYLGVKQRYESLWKQKTGGK